MRGFVQGLVTSDVTGPLPVWAGLLTPQGKCLFDFIVWADGEDLLLDCEAAAADDLIKRLAIYRLRRPITIERDPGAGRALVTGTAKGPPILGFRNLATAGLGQRMSPRSGWLEHRLRLGVCEGRLSSATSSGWNAMPPS